MAAKWSPTASSPQPVGEPGARRGGVGHRLRGGEGLRGDEEERALRVEAGERVGEMRAVDVGDEMHARPAVAIGRERRRRHRRAEVGAADADIDDVGEAVGGDAADLAGADLRRRSARNRSSVCMHLRHDVLAVDADVGVRRRAQRDVQDGAVLGDVDRLAGEHRIAQRRRRSARFGEREEERHRLGDDAVLRIVERQVAERRARSARSGPGSTAKRSRRCGLPIASRCARSSSSAASAAGFTLRSRAATPRAPASRCARQSPRADGVLRRDPGAADADDVGERQIGGGVLRVDAAGRAEADRREAARRAPSGRRCRRPARPERISGSCSRASISVITSDGGGGAGHAAGPANPPPPSGDRR